MKVVAATKANRCSLCSGSIQAGEQITMASTKVGRSTTICTPRHVACQEREQAKRDLLRRAEAGWDLTEAERLAQLDVAHVAAAGGGS